MRELGTVNWVKSLNTRILGITSKRTVSFRFY